MHWPSSPTRREGDIAEANTDETKTRTVDKLMNNVNDQEKGLQETAAISKESKMMDESSGGILGGRTKQKPTNRKLADDSDDDLPVKDVQESHKKKISGVSRINNNGKISRSLEVSAENIEDSCLGNGASISISIHARIWFPCPKSKERKQCHWKGRKPVVVMSDYAEAHRRPPIHNLSP
ncbi:hypothetical protein MKX01_030930 [Papaver californicum]|nr:hypothetical protein MKX01_030930 [Papaver californicum]